MRYQLKHKLVSIGGDSMIQDGEGRDLYFVDGKALSIGRRLEVKDMAGNVLAEIRQQLLALSPNFNIDVTNGGHAHLKMKLLSLRDHLKVEVDGGQDLEARGNLLHHEYEIQRGGRVVAHISKAWVALADTYGIEIADGEDQLLLLCVAVVIDSILEKREHAD